MTAIWFGLVLFLGGGDGSDQSGALTWNRAERAYRSGQYETASALFDGTLSDPTIARGPALYNLGNCAYRLGRYVDAALYYRRALVRMPRDPEITFNLSLAERHMGIEAPARSLVGTVILWAQKLPPGILLLLAAALQGIGLFGLMRMSRGRRARVAMALLVLTGVLGTLGLGYDSLFPGSPVAMGIR